MTVRADIVALLAGMDWSHSNFPDSLIHEDGRPFSDADIALVGEATVADLIACQQYMQTVVDFAADRAAKARRMAELANPHWGMPGVKTMGDVLKVMAEAERNELRAILDELFPDGNLVILDPPP